MGLFKKKHKKQELQMTVTINKKSEEELKKELEDGWKQQGCPCSTRIKISTNRADNDELYKKKNEAYIRYLKDGEIGSAASEMYGMALIVEKEGNLKDALWRYYYVCYVHLWGFSSIVAYNMWLTNSKIIKPLPLLAPGVINRIRIVQKKTRLSLDEMKELFYDVSEDEGFAEMHLFTADECFKFIQDAIEQGVDEINEKIKKLAKKRAKTR